MPGAKRLVLDGQSLLNLLTHYTDGAIDLDAKLVSLGVHQILNREIGLYVESSQWKDEKIPGKEYYSPLYIKYEANKVFKWGQKDQDVAGSWGDEGKTFEKIKRGG